MVISGGTGLAAIKVDFESEFGLSHDPRLADGNEIAITKRRLDDHH